MTLIYLYWMSLLVVLTLVLNMKYIQLLQILQSKGKSIIMISSEMPELIGMSDRIVVMCDGRVSGEVSGEEATQENIMSLATKFA